MLRKILVPLDGSEFGEHALPLAASLARKAGAMLHLVHVHQPAPAIPSAGLDLINLYDLHLRRDEEAYVAYAASRVRDLTDVPATSVTLEGTEVARAVREYAEAVKAELVVMATHGRGTLGRWWLGSVTDDLARTLSRPIVLVRPEEGKTDLTRKPDLRCVVIALDGTALAEEVIEPAVETGQPFEASYALVRVCAPEMRISYLPEGTTLHGLPFSALEEIAAAQRQAITDCHAYLDAVADRLRARGLRATAHVVVEEDPSVGILAVAQERGAGLIAMETHGRVGLSRLFMGSIADRVVRSGGIPVLVNRPAH